MIWHSMGTLHFRNSYISHSHSMNLSLLSDGKGNFFEAHFQIFWAWSSRHIFKPIFSKLSKPQAIIFLLWTTKGQKFTKSDLIWACKSWAWGIVCQTKVGMPVPITKPVKLIKVLFNYPNPCQTNNYFPSDYSL